MVSAGTYFREKAIPSGDAGATVDLAIDDAAFSVQRDPTGQTYLVAHVVNKGSAVSAPFQIWFFRANAKPGEGKKGEDAVDLYGLYGSTDGKTAKPMTHGGGPIKPGESWNEACAIFALEPGENTYYVEIDPDNAVKETDETNNTAKLTIKGKKVVKEVVEVE